MNKELIIGATISYCCSMLDNGLDPRKELIPKMAEEILNALATTEPEDEDGDWYIYGSDGKRHKIQNKPNSQIALDSTKVYLQSKWWKEQDKDNPSISNYVDWLYELTTDTEPEDESSEPNWSKEEWLDIMCATPISNKTCEHTKLTEGCDCCFEWATGTPSPEPEDEAVEKWRDKFNALRNVADWETQLPSHAKFNMQAIENYKDWLQEDK